MSPVRVRPPLLRAPPISFDGARFACPRQYRLRSYAGTTRSRGRHSAVAKATDIRPKITMACVECKSRNYITRKNRRNDPDRIELKKFCPRCGKHTAHRETR